MQKTFIDLFAGCGGMSKGLENAGFKCVGFVEFWQPAIDTHLNNCEGVLIGKDITQIQEKDIKQYAGTIDVVVGGPPCQGFSMAGKRDVNDNRNRLFIDYLRFISIIKPKFFVMENVQGIGSMKNPEGESVFKEIMQMFKNEGYEVEAKVLNSSNYNVPQTRQRAIFIGNRIGAENKYPVFQKKKFLKEILDLPYEEIEDLQHIYEKPKKLQNYRFSHIKEGSNYGLFKSTNKKLKSNGFSCTITKSGRYIHPEYNRIVSVRECARIQTFSDDFKFCGSMRQMYMQIGNAVPVQMAEAIGRSIMEGFNEKHKNV
jgi:DNA (cytosine-5)-methyltransferase 1